jgi:hypothetical protein
MRERFVRVSNRSVIKRFQYSVFWKEEVRDLVVYASGWGTQFGTENAVIIEREEIL